MAWSVDFETCMATGRAIPCVTIVSMNSLVDCEFPGSDFGTLRLSSVTLSGYNRGIVTSSIVLSDENLDLRTMQYSGGSWKFRYVPQSATDAEDFLKKCRRGTPVQLRVGFVGWVSGDYEPYASGLVHSITRVGQYYDVEVWDMLSSLLRQISTGLIGLNAVFWKSGNENYYGVLDAAYTAGDTSFSVTLTSLSWSAETSGKYGIYVIPTTGDPFYLYATGMTEAAGVASFTGVSTTGQRGTTAVNAALGDTVLYVALLEGHPCSIYEQMLVSTDAHTNGTADVYPVEWGYQIPEEWVDRDDIDTVRVLTDVTSGLTVTWYAGEEESGLQAFTEWSGDFGIFASQRMGMLTLGCLQDLWSSPTTDLDDTLLTEHLLSAVSVLYSEDTPFEYIQYGIRATAGNSYVYADEYPTYPITASKDIALAGPNEYAYETSETPRYLVYQNENNITDETGPRIAKWFTRPATVFQCRVVPWPWRKLKVGSVIYVQSSILFGRDGATNAGVTDLTPVMVIRKRDGFPQPWVDLDLATYPEDEADGYVP